MTQPSQGGAITADGASAPISEDVAITSKNYSLPRRAASAVKSIASKLLTLELCILVLLAAVVFGPQLFGIQTYGILTGSMEPAIQTGALTFVDTGVSGADLRPGDVAAFDIGEGRICTHRVVSVDPENQTITTKGDANATEDLNPVAFEDVFGKTVGSVPGLGAALISFTENRVAWLLAIGGVTVFLLVLSCALPDAAEHVVPLQTIAKDPVVKNESDVEAWLFCQIKVPTASVSVVGEDGTPEAAASHELFTYTVNEGWTEHGTPVAADGYTTHTYLYNTKVAANSQTAKAVFDDVTLINLVEAQGVSGPDQIDVIGHGIQAEGLDTAAAAWTAYTAQNA